MKSKIFMVLMIALFFSITGCDFWGPSNPFSTTTTTRISTTTSTTSTIFSTTTSESIPTTGPTWTTTSEEPLPFTISFYDVGGDILWDGNFYEGEYIYMAEMIPFIYLDFPGWDQNIPSYMPAANYELHALFSFDLVFTAERTVWMSNTEKEVVVIPEEINGIPVERIESDAFARYDMENHIRTISIPSSVFQIDPYAFRGSIPNLEEINVEPNNPFFTSVDGVLYDKEMTVLYKYPAAKLDTEFTIPSTVIVIMEYAFQGANHLELIDFPDNLFEIHEGAFANMQNLKEISLPTSLESLDNDIFAGDFELERISIPFIGHDRGSEWDLIILFGEDFSSENEYSLQEIHITDARAVYLDGYSLFPNVTTISMNEGVEQIIAIRNFPSLTSIDIPSTVTAMEDYAFYGDESITSMSIPNSVIWIGRGVFAGIPGLVSLSLPFVGSCQEPQSYNEDTLGYLFGNNIPSTLVEIHITNQPTITNMDLYGASSIVTVYIGESTSMIINPSFYAMEHLESIVVSENNPYLSSVNGVLFDKSQETLIAYPSHKPGNEYTLPSTVTVISPYAFSDAVFLQQVYLNDGLIQIGNNAFYNAVLLEDIAISATVTSIGFEAFQGTDNLQEIYVEPGNVSYVSMDGILYNAAMTQLIKYPSAKTNVEFIVPNSVYTIQFHAFYNTIYLQTLSLQDHVHLSSDTWLFGASNLVNIHVSSGNNYNASIGGVLFSKDLTEIWKYPEGRMEEAYTIPDGVEYIYYDCFANLKGLTTLVIPASVSYISSEAFVNSNSLSVIVVSPGSNFFSVLDNVLFSVDYSELILYPAGLQNHDYIIPNSVTKISTYAFYETQNLTSISIPSSVTTIEDYAFFHISGCTIYAEVSSQPDGWDSGWKDASVNVEWGAQIPE